MLAAFEHCQTLLTRLLCGVCGEECVQEEQGGGGDRMTRRMFQQFLHTRLNMTDRVISEQIFKYFNEVHDSEITREEWVLGFYVLLKGRMGIISMIGRSW